MAKGTLDIYNERSPLVSVLMPAHNAARFIDSTLRSVLNQTYTNIEVVVVDDGSTDNTSELVSMFAQRDSRVRLFCQPNLGVAAARNKAFVHSRGKFVAPIDADDSWLPTNLEKQVALLVNAGPNVGVVYSWSIDIDENDCPTENFRASSVQGAVFATLLCHFFLGNASSSLMRRECVEQVGCYTTEFRSKGFQGCEDWQLYLDIARRYEFRVVPEFLVLYRRASEAMSQCAASMAGSHELIMRSVSEKSPDLPAALLRLSRSSFCIYLAHQSAAAGDRRSARHWLLMALRSDCVTPLFRPDVYSLCASLFHANSNQESTSRLTQPSNKPNDYRFDFIDFRRRHRFRIIGKLYAQSLLHQVLRLIYRGQNRLQASPRDDNAPDDMADFIGTAPCQILKGDLSQRTTLDIDMALPGS